MPFIWMVADYVMERDRRAWWMRHWLLGTRAIETREVFERSEPVLLVINDADTLIDVANLEPGERAERKRVGGRWKRQRDD